MGPDTAPNRNQRFEQLVDQYQKPVLYMCYLYLCDKTLAEDAVQETFLKVYKRMDAFRKQFGANCPMEQFFIRNSENYLKQLLRKW